MTTFMRLSVQLPSSSGGDMTTYLGLNLHSLQDFASFLAEVNYFINIPSKI